MDKKLSEMTLRELWELFPIYLTEHKDVWADWYAEEREKLQKILPEESEIYHIGSTAIPAIWAKPIVDILIETPSDLQTSARCLEEAGYLKMSENAKRISFNKGYTEQGFAEKVFHVHLQCPGGKEEVLFRDYLNTHIDAAKRYEALKLQLWKKYEFNRDAYTAAKSDFVNDIVGKAKKEVAGKQNFYKI